MTYRDMMRSNDQNMSWCKPMFSADERVKFNLAEGRIETLIIDGVETDATPEMLTVAAKIVNEYYAEYFGWSDTHIIMDAGLEERACRECPWFSVCAQMDEDAEFWHED